MGLGFCRVKVSYSGIQALWTTRSLFCNSPILHFISILLILFTCGLKYSRLVQIRFVGDSV